MVKTWWQRFMGSFFLHSTPWLQVQSYLIAKERLCLAWVKSAKDMETLWAKVFQGCECRCSDFEISSWGCLLHVRGRCLTSLFILMLDWAGTEWGWSESFRLRFHYLLERTLPIHTLFHFLVSFFKTSHFYSKWRYSGTCHHLDLLFCTWNLQLSHSTLWPQPLSYGLTICLLYDLMGTCNSRTLCYIFIYLLQVGSYERGVPDCKRDQA